MVRSIVLLAVMCALDDGRTEIAVLLGTPRLCVIGDALETLTRDRRVDVLKNEGTKL